MTEDSSAVNGLREDAPILMINECRIIDIPKNDMSEFVSKGKSRPDFVKSVDGCNNPDGGASQSHTSNASGKRSANQYVDMIGNDHRAR